MPFIFFIFGFFFFEYIKNPKADDRGKEWRKGQGKFNWRENFPMCSDYQGEIGWKNVGIRKKKKENKIKRRITWQNYCIE